MLLLSEQVRLTEYDPSDRTACAGADECLLNSCARLFAVGDGSPSTGQESMARSVAFARNSGVDVEALRPDGASRTALEKVS
ncbi:hypothetical protein ACFXKC_12250 [Streptomyces sp. NPDC059340]|uniref:hypothetical protein n=1 Tax=Streptomyces sp. NPDC059340 TaxID=3346806 RepID=UPI0036CE32B1